MSALNRIRHHPKRKKNLQPSTPLLKPFARTRCWLLQPQRPQQEILNRKQSQENAIAQIRQPSHESRHQRIHPVVVRGCDDGDEDHRRIADPYENVKELPSPVLPDFSLLQRPAKNPSMVNHGAPDDESIAKMHARHSSEGVDIIAGHEDASSVGVANCVEEAVFGREQARRHARVKGEG